MSKKYIEIVLDFMNEKAKVDNAFIIEEIKEYALKINRELTKIQIKNSLYNFVKLSLIESKGDEVYYLNVDRITAFFEQYKNGLVPIWRKKKSSINENKIEIEYKNITELPEQYKNNQAFHVRAMLAAFPGPFSTKRLLELAKEIGFNYIPRKTFENIRQHLKGSFDLKGLDDNVQLFALNCNFYKKFKKEKGLYLLVFPDREDFINSSFAMALDEQKTIGSSDDQNASKEPEEEQVVKTESKDRPINDSSPRYIIAAIFAAYERSLSIRDIIRIASNFGYQVKYGTVNSYCSKHKAKYLIITGKRSSQHLYSPCELFFENYSDKIDHLVEILPEKKDKIKARFNVFFQSEPIVEKIEEDNAKIDQAAIVDTEEEAYSNENEGEYVEAARVGASIIKYIRTLQMKLKKRDEDPTELNELKDKLEQSQLYNISLKNENQNLEYQIEKLKGMLETSNEKLIALNHQLSVLKNRRQNEKEPLPTKFSLSELARVTRFVKDSRSNGKIMKRVEESVE